MLYAFGGRSTSSNHLTSIERVNARKHINKEIRQMGQTEDERNHSEVEEGIDTWEIIILKGPRPLDARFHPILVSVS